MVVEIRVTGAEQLRKLGADLKVAGSAAGGLRRDLLAAMRALEKPLVEKARQSARDSLPRRGGLNEWVGVADIKFRNSLTGARVGARVVAVKGKHDLSDLDGTGTIRHPVFGHRGTWVNQTVATGWFSKPMEAAAPEVQAALVAAIAATTTRLEKGI